MKVTNIVDWRITKIGLVDSVVRKITTKETNMVTGPYRPIL